MKIDKLMLAIKKHDINYINEILLQKNIQEQLDLKNREAVLLASVEYGNVETLDLMLKMKCDVNARVFFEGMSYRLLECACLCNQTKIVEYLLSNGCDLNNDAILYAASKGETEIVDLLLKAGADINHQDYEQRTALHWAAQEGYADIIKLLLEHGCKIDQKDGSDMSPLYIAVGENRFEIANLLLDLGANPNSSNPFQLACAWQYYPLCDLLLDYGADIDAIDADGRTALFHSIIVRDQKMTDYLFGKGASSHVIDYFGISVDELKNDQIRRQIYDDLHGER